MRRGVFWKNPGYIPGKVLKGMHHTRLLIIGGGITGLTLAHFLLEGGMAPKDVLLVEAESAGSGSTGRSAGMLVPEMETEKNVGWDELRKKYGLRLTKAYRRAHLEALGTIKNLIKVGNISCDARKGDFLILARDQKAKKRIESDIAVRKEMGEHPAMLRGMFLANEFGSPGFIFAERNLKALSVNPLALAQGIATYLRRRGVRIYERSPLMSTYKTTARFVHGAVEFEKIIYARGMGEGHPHLHKYVTTIAVTEKLDQHRLQDLRLADLDMFIDEEGVRSFHYGKITGDGRLLLGYGDVRTREHQAAARLHEPHLRNIRRFLKNIFPHTTLRIDYAWSGAYAIGPSLLPIISFKKNVVMVNGAGIQLGSVAAAHYAAAKLLGKKHPLGPLWHPDR